MNKQFRAAVVKAAADMNREQREITLARFRAYGFMHADKLPEIVELISCMKTVWDENPISDE